jgi:branched-chain amino acid transport system permease protein
VTLDPLEAKVERPAAGRALPIDWIVGAVVVAALVLAPFVATEYFLSAIMTQALWLGIAAASLIYLAGYGGMVSLGQVALYGISAMTYANLVEADGGYDTAISPYLAMVIALLVTLVVGLIFGLVAARSEGIYFLMITLSFGVIVFFFFGAATNISGFGGVNDVLTPEFIDRPTTEPNGLYVVTATAAVLVFVLIRYIARTPFGLTLQGIRDDPARMRALGYNVVLHRTLAFGFGALIAGIAGILAVSWNTRIDPNSINLGQTIDLLVIAVIGGLLRLEGAWIGAIVFVCLDNYTRGTDLIGDRFNTVIGVIFLLVVLLSPGGLMGVYAMLRDRLRRPSAEAPPPSSAAPASETAS